MNVTLAFDTGRPINGRPLEKCWGRKKNKKQKTKQKTKQKQKNNKKRKKIEKKFVQGRQGKKFN